MTVKDCFEKYRSRMIAEGAIKAVLCGLAVGLGVNAIVAFITWCISGFNGLWLSIGCGLGAWAVAAPLFYMFLFKPTVKQIAERVDKLGLEERAITMLELENDNSVIAGLQREDAKCVINSVGSGSLKISLFGKLTTAAKAVAITVMAVLVACGVSMTTLTGLADKGIIGTPVPDEPAGVKELKFGSVRYVAQEGGLLIGEEADQLVLVEGVEKDYFAVTVTATPEYGYQFLRWSDQEPVYEDIKAGWMIIGQREVPQDPTRTDSFEVGEDGKIKLVAKSNNSSANDFSSSLGNLLSIVGGVENTEGEEKVESGENAEDGENVIYAIFQAYDDSNPHPENGNGNGNNSGNSSGNMNSDDMPPEGGSSSSGGSGGGDSSYDGEDAAAKEEKNQIEDGDTYYRTKYEQYLAEARKYIAEGKPIPAELKAIIELYADIIA